VKSLHGKVRIEDAGFDWKVLGPDVPKNERDIEYIAW
jgi:1-pyrroline-5-carboxylate dehydrogenase